MTPDRFTRQRVAIIGGGVAGSLAAIMLARLPHIESISLIDRNAAFGRGLAYSAPAEWHRINVPAYKMGGIGAEDAEGFQDWLIATGQANWQNYSDAFVPRKLYGDYIGAELEQATKGGRVNLSSETIVEIRRVGNHYELTDAAHKRFDVDLVFLCLGNPPPSAFPGIDASARSITDVWAPGALDPIGTNDRVLIIGTGATAVDMVIELIHRGMRQPMTMISRRGLLPLVDAPAQTDPNPLAAWPVATARGVLATLLRDTRAKIAAGVPWQTPVDTFRLHIADLWTRASQPERERFARHLRAIWLVHRHRLAPDVAELLQRLEAEQRLDVLAGRIIGARATADGHDVTIRKRGGAEVRLVTDWILNCTGPEERYDRIGNPLVKSMLASGIAAPGNNGLGLDVDVNCRLRDSSGQSQPGLYAIGHATRGAFWEVTAASNIRSQLLDIVRTLTSAPVTA